MAESSKGSILSFTKEQGFGRVAVEGKGELSFDATVTLAKPEELLPGTKVNILVGPSRIPGKLKVTQLWLESGSSEPARFQPAEAESTLMVGPYELRLPGFWADKEHKIREKPGLFAYNAAVTGGVSFDFMVFPGLAADLEQKQRVVAAYVEGHRSPAYSKGEELVEGTRFEKHRFDGSASLGADTCYELYLGEVYGDRLAFGFAMKTAEPRRESLRFLFLAMVGAAIIRRGYAVAKP